VEAGEPRANPVPLTAAEWRGQSKGKTSVEGQRVADEQTGSMTTVLPFPDYHRPR
jgi:hypothetical protein